MSNVIELLQQQHLLWPGSQQQSSASTISSGYPELDKQLGGGFPARGVTEICTPTAIGELRLLTPCLHKAGHKRLTAFINPPGYLNSDYLQAHGLDLDNVLFMRPRKETQALWAAEQCLKSGCCSSVLLWSPTLEIHQAKRLQVASEAGNALHFYFHTRKTHSLTLPVSLTLTFTPEKQGLHISIAKRKGGWIQSELMLDMSRQWPGLTIPSPCHNHRPPVQSSRRREA
ncbi:translesion DNA synthesis-associated protein ImuA [Vibrio albus]|uniref:Translesion DNA synthesis-associated protein ImuA n=1 Tax=Vibrio albus TaxID=2200953 RepID=A0A2U3BE31_9VIBR|nr:translesion DNA synthesis-associated protein ImuA [Vibrio albus]PWI34984.1 translesion DNA synthesis-associated protein ImuA [Vibrio albus]